MPAPVFDFGLRAMQRTTYDRASIYPVVGWRLYFHCGCRRRAGFFPWVTPDWELLDWREGNSRLCATHFGIEVCEDLRDDD